jgi:hypothetical protein
LVVAIIEVKERAAAPSPEGRDKYTELPANADEVIG